MQAVHLSGAVEVQGGRGRDVWRGYVLALDAHRRGRGSAVHLTRSGVVVVVGGGGLVGRGRGAGVELRGGHVVGRGGVLETLVGMSVMVLEHVGGHTVVLVSAVQLVRRGWQEWR